MPKPRVPAGRFLGPNGIRHAPMREVPVIADEKQLVDRIRDAASIRDEPECVGPRWLKDYADAAKLHQSQQHSLDVANAQTTRPLLAAEDRLKDLHRRAKHSHVDLSHEIHIMQRELNQARLRGRPAPVRVLVRMTRLETTLDGIAA